MSDDHGQQPAAEQPDALTNARHIMDAAYRKFRKAAGGLQLATLLAALEVYQEAQYQATITAEKAKFGRA